MPDVSRNVEVFECILQNVHFCCYCIIECQLIHGSVYNKTVYYTDVIQLAVRIVGVIRDKVLCAKDNPHRSFEFTVR